MVEGAKVWEDSAYEQNIGVRKDACEERQQYISDIKYFVKLWMPHGDHYCGKISISFKTKKDMPSGYQLPLDFRGQKIAKLTINGTEIQAEKVFEKQSIALDSQFLKKEGEENSVELLIKNKYRKDGVGIHNFTDPEDGKQYLYTQFESDYCRFVFPVFDQPDLKAHWTFTAVVESDWTVISNEYVNEEANTENLVN